MPLPPLELAIVVPTFNERENVAELARRLEAVLDGRRWELVFVDDDSPDGTAGVVRELAQAMPHVRCLLRLGRRGLSRAAIEGILSTTAPVVVVMDADLQHDESALPRMLERIDSGADLVVASRYTQGGGVGEWAASRARLSRLGTLVARRLARVEVSDPMSGFFAIRRARFDLAVRGLSGEGYKLLLDLLATLPRDTVVQEVPYVFRNRAAGESKLDSAVLWEFSLLLLDKRIGRWISPRFVLFALVGLSGVAVHFAVLTLAFRVAGLPFAQAQAAATVLAMTSNYAFNNSLTYRDRRHHGLGWLRGLLSFYLVCGLGVVANVGVANALFAGQGWLLAAAAGALVGTGWNFVATRAITWRSR